MGLKERKKLKIFFARKRKSDISFYFVEIESESMFENGEEVREGGRAEGGGEGRGVGPLPVPLPTLPRDEKLRMSRDVKTKTKGR